MHAENRDPLGKLGVVGGHDSAVPEAAEVLGREEAEAADRASRSHPLALLIPGADGLGRVFDDRYAELGSERKERAEVDRLAKKVDGDDRLEAGAARRRSAGCRGVEVVGRWIDVREHGLRRRVSRPRPRSRRTCRKDKSPRRPDRHRAPSTRAEGRLSQKRRKSRSEPRNTERSLAPVPEPRVRG